MHSLAKGSLHERQAGRQTNTNVRLQRPLGLSQSPEESSNSGHGKRLIVTIRGSAYLIFAGPRT